MKIGFVGGGKMAEAMVAGLIRRGVAAADGLMAGDVSEERRAWLRQQYGIAVSDDNREVAAFAGVLVLAVKPQQLGDVLAGLAPVVGGAHLVLSIAAGKTVAFLEAGLPSARVIRVMPNLACQVFEGMSVFCLGSRASDGDRRQAGAVLSCLGRVLELPEADFDAVTALSGSGPAFFAYLLDRMVDASVAEGLNREHALVLASQTMLGTARVLLERGTRPEELIAAVASARGTTAAGLAVLGGSAVGEILGRTVAAAAERSRELSR